MSYPLIELGGAPDSPVMVIAIANGFVPQMYSPLLEPFFADYRVVSLPPRPLWQPPQDPPPITADAWQSFADDLLAGLEEHDLRGIIAIGHSVGAITWVLAALKEPARIGRLILLDPTILTPAVNEGLKMAQQMGMADQHPLAKVAMRRRRHFDSAKDAFQHFLGKKLFQEWPQSTLRIYAEEGTMPDGEGVVLRFSPEWEAFIFSTGYAGIWDDMPKIDGLLPTLIVQGSSSDVFITESFDAIKKQVPSATHKQVIGQGHLFPFSAPEQAAQKIREWLG